MFGIGLGELAVIGIIVLVLVNPRDLPRLVRRVGRLWGQLARELRDARRLLDELEHQGSAGASAQEDLGKPPESDGGETGGGSGPQP